MLQSSDLWVQTAMLDMLKALMDEVDVIQEQMDSISKVTKILTK